MRTSLLILFLVGSGCRPDNLNEVPDGAGVNVTTGGTSGSGGGSDGGAPDLAHASSTGGGCGSCPSGYTCGSANGIPVCRAPSGIPELTNAFVIVMENTSLSSLQKAGNTPFLQGLFMSAAWSADYHGVAHPSLPNYIALTSGGTQNIGCDCNPQGSACSQITCNALLSSCGCGQAAQHIGDQLEAAGKTWKAYAEDMGTACNLTSAGAYATRHVPFLYYMNMQMSPSRCGDHAVDFSAFAGDLANPPNFAFIAPNLTDDMHDPVPAGAQNYANGDTWLSTVVPQITGSDAFKKGGLLVIVWDEDDLSGVLAKDDPIPMILISPLAKSSGYTSMTHADHYALLATLEDGLALPRLGNAAQATPLDDFFPAN